MLCVKREERREYCSCDASCETCLTCHPCRVCRAPSGARCQESNSLAASISLTVFRRGLTVMEIEEGREVRRAAYGPIHQRVARRNAGLHTFRWVTHATGFATKNFDFLHLTSFNHQPTIKRRTGLGKMRELPMASLEGLPGDVMAHILELLPASDLARLREVSRVMDRRVSNLSPRALLISPLLQPMSKICCRERANPR